MTTDDAIRLILNLASQAAACPEVNCGDHDVPIEVAERVAARHAALVEAARAVAAEDCQSPALDALRAALAGEPK